MVLILGSNSATLSIDSGHRSSSKGSVAIALVSSLWVAPTAGTDPGRESLRRLSCVPAPRDAPGMRL